MLKHRVQGFTLVELMVTVAIIAILSAIALPLYNSYISSSREGVLVNNISSVELFEEDYKLRKGNYLVTAADKAAIKAGIGWEPQSDDGTTYSIADGGGGTYKVTATDTGGTVVCMRLPDKTRC